MLHNDGQISESIPQPTLRLSDPESEPGVGQGRADRGNRGFDWLRHDGHNEGHEIM